MMAFIVGGATSSLATMDASAQKLRMQLDTINHYMRYRRVPNRLRKRVDAYFQYLWTCMRGLDDTDVMESMPISLRRQLSIAMNRKLFTRVPLFRYCDAGCILTLVEHLRPLIAVPREYIIREGAYT